MTAKRAIWIIRALFYGSVALVALVLLLARGDDDAEPSGPITLTGRTEQDTFINASFRDGRIFRMRAWARVACSNGRDYDWRWIVTEGKGAHFVTDGERVRIKLATTKDLAWTGIAKLDLDARASGARMTGTIDTVIDVSAPFRGTCRSGRLRFSAAG